MIPSSAAAPVSATSPRKTGAARVVRESPLDNVSLHLVDSLDEALKLKNWLGERRETPLGVDTESEGLDPFRHDLRLVQVGDMRTGWAIPYPLWGGLAQEILNEYEGDFVAHNCFSEDTKFITRDGSKTFIETVGTIQEVWTEIGWKKAHIRCYGTAPTMEIVLAPYNRSRTTIRHRIRVTANHRWIVDRAQWHEGARRWLRLAEIQTESLRVGDRIPAETPRLYPNENSDGFRHGMILADGAACSDHRAYQIRLCGWKEKFKNLFKSYTYPASAEGDPVVNRYHPTIQYNLKAVPPEDADAQYICDFIAGWAALDGTDNSDPHSRTIHTTKKINAEWLQRNASNVGWIVTGFNESFLESKWAKAEKVYAITLSQNPDLAWTVREITASDSEEEEVYCAEVEDVGAFTLAFGIYTANSSFDWRFLYKRGGITLPWHKLHDTIILASLDDPTRPRGLKPLSAALVDKGATRGERALHEGMKKNGWTWATVPYSYPAYYAYSALDPCLTTHLWNYLYPRVISDCPSVYELERGITRICSKMMLKGIHLDRAYTEANIAKLNDYAQQSRRWLEEAHGIKNPLSARQISAAIERAGWQITETTATGLPKVDKNTLQQIGDTQGAPLEAQQIAKYVLGVRHLEKITGSYLENFLTSADDEDNIHASLNPLQARTGRMSVTTPALQTLPRESSSTVRGSFSPREGYAFISIDASQIEARLAAALSGDERMIAAFAEADAGGRDFYSGIATELFGEEITKDDNRRQLTKNLTFAKIYGAGVEKMALTVGLPVEVVRPIDEAFNKRFPGLHRMMNRVTRESKNMQARGEVPCIRTTRGRKLPVDENKIYSGLNYTIQGEAAEILKVGILDIDAAGYGDNLIMLVHDEIMAEIEKDRAEEALRDFTDILNKSTNYAVPIPWEGKVMYERWAK